MGQKMFANGNKANRIFFLVSEVTWPFWYREEINEPSSFFYLKHLFDPILWNVIVNDQSLRQQRRMSLGADQKVKVQTILVVT